MVLWLSFLLIVLGYSGYSNVVFFPCKTFTQLFHYFASYINSPPRPPPPTKLFKSLICMLLSLPYRILACSLRKSSCLPFTGENEELPKIFFEFFLEGFVLTGLLLVFIFLFLFLCTMYTYVPCKILSDYFSFFPQG